MLSLCRAMGYDCNDYYLPDHPVQQLIKNTVAAYAQIIPSGIVIGIDGCGVPVFGLPLLHMAISYLNLCNQGSMESERLTLASRRIVNAIINYPEMIAGTGQFCTELSKATRGRIVGKLGSDGVYCCAVTDGGMALALKVEDGNGEASPPIIIEALKQLGLLSYEEQQLLTKFAIIDNINCQEEKIGETRPVFKLI